MQNPEYKSIDDFKNAIQLLRSQGLHKEAEEFERGAKARGLKIGSAHTEEWLEKFLTQDPDMLSLKDDVRALANEDDPILIRGETGTGKELIANALHGSRAGRFVAINCPALSTDLMFSELFGHVKGAFTGAIADRQGKFAAAQGGTLFIDEVGDMPPEMQAMLLRVVQERTYHRVGENVDIKTDARIVCATNKPLEDMVSKGSFREDLLARLNVFELQLKSLDDRREDIKLICDSLDKKFFPAFIQTQKGRLMLYERTNRWKDNVRGLQKLVRRWKILGKI